MKDNDRRKHNIFLYILVPVSIIMAIIIPLYFTNPWIIFLLLITYLIFILSCFNSKWALFSFIVIRPALDFSTHETILNLPGFNLNFAGVLGIIIILFALVVFIKEKKKIQKPLVLYTWIFFIIVNIISLFLSINTTASFVEIARLLSIFSMFILGFLLINNKKDLTTLIKVLIFSSVIPSLSALWQLINGIGLKEGDESRVYGTFAHPNMLAFFLVLSIILIIFIFLNVKKRKVSFIFYAILIILEGLILIFTYTRGAWLVLFLSIIILGILRYRKLLLLSVLILLMFYMLIPPFQGRINSMIKTNPYGSISWRIKLWEDAYSYIQERPILGYGTGVAAMVIDDRRGPKFGSPEPHNDYVRVALNTGLLGLFSYLMLALSLLASLIYYFYKEKGTNLKMFNLLFLVFISSLFLMSFGDNIFNDTSLQWLIWVLSGALISSQIKLKKHIMS